MTNSKCRTQCCLATLIFVAVAFFTTFLYVPQMVLVPVMSIKATLFQRNSSSTETEVATSLLDNSLSTARPDTLKEVDNRRASPATAVQLLNSSAIKHKVQNIDCQALFNGSVNDTLHAKKLARNVSVPIPDLAYLNLTVDCSYFQSSRGYIMSSLSQEEEDFPIAFSMVVFKEAEMVERLLKAIYRPQNYYCIHVDIKSPDVFYRALSSIAKCFSNVFLASTRINVQWGWFSVLEPEFQCMEELWRYPRWKYFMTLTGQEFPLKTNFELVKIFTALDGANDIECTIKRANRERWRSPPPAGIRPVKGSVHITVNRDFVDFVLHSPVSKSLLAWLKANTTIPDETLFATLNHNPQLGIRGSYIGDAETNWDEGPIKPFLTRYKNWGAYKCSGGVYVRGICIFTLGTTSIKELNVDLPTASSSMS